MELLLSVNDAARRLCVGRTKLYELVANGEIKLVKLGRKSLITSASVEEFVERICEDTLHDR